MQEQDRFRQTFRTKALTELSAMGFLVDILSNSPRPDYISPEREFIEPAKEPRTSKWHLRPDLKQFVAALYDLRALTRIRKRAD
jgi:hypothetical protein